MKNYTGALHNITGRSAFSRNQSAVRNFNLLAGVKDEYQFPGFDHMLSDLLQSESDYGIYPQVGKYSEIFNRVIPKK